MPRQHLDRIEKLADSAGLSLWAVTPASLTLRSAMRPSAESSVSLLVESDAAELILQENGAPRLLRYLPISGPGQSAQDAADIMACLATLSNEVKRATILMPSAASLPRSLAIWDGIGLVPSQAELLTQRMGMRVHLNGDLSLLGIATNNGAAANAGRFGPAIALALAGAKPDLLGVNFLHSRLTPTKTRRFGHRAILAAIVLIATVAAGGLLVLDLRRSEAELADLQSRLEKMQPDIRDAENIAARFSFARDWYERRPPFLSCLKEISAAFPDEGQIWASSFSVRDNRHGQLAGRATDQRTVLTVMDRLKNNKKFADVKLQDMRDAGGNRREVSFSLNFTFTALE